MRAQRVFIPEGACIPRWFTVFVILFVITSFYMMYYFPRE